MSTAGNARNLNESRAEALQALERVSDRLGQILGEVPGDGTHRNENGELVNEEGLPIIDITEPLDDLDTPSLSAATDDDVIEEDNYPEPISQLSPEALAVSRKHRDKILELLEEEETREEWRTRQEQQAELLKKRDAARSEMQKRMETQSAELEKRRRAKELEVKMAKALIGGLRDPGPVVVGKVDTDKKEKKKNVTFAEVPSTSDAMQSQSKQHPERPTQWGDVVPGRLSEKQRLASRSRTQPMKMEVIERQTVTTKPPSDPSPPVPDLLVPEDIIGDSDDESDAEEHSDSTVAFDSGDEDVILSAHHHRELALEYHRRRETLASSAVQIHSEDLGSNNPNDWENEDVPLEATLAHAPPKSSVSKFKAESTITDSGPIDPLPGPSRGPGLPTSSRLSTFGTAVLPPSAIAKSVKMGKLVDGQLVSGYEDDDDREAREEEEIRKLLLKSMEDYSGIAAQVMGPAGSYWAAPQAGGSDSLPPPPPQVKPKPKVSRFKVNRSQIRDPSEATMTSPAPPKQTQTTILSSKRSGSTTPPSSVRRSSPKPIQGEGIPTPDHSHVISSNLPHTNIIDSPSFSPRRSSPLRGTSTPDSIIDSPSFPNLNPMASSSAFSSVVDSPSFAPPTVIESPSFLRPTNSTPSESKPPHSRSIPGAEPTRPTAREPVTMADNVVERTTNTGSSVTRGAAKPQRVSRFKAERTDTQ